MSQRRPLLMLSSLLLRASPSAGPPAMAESLDAPLDLDHDGGVAVEAN
jgi:hypothetical protein